MKLLNIINGRSQQQPTLESAKATLESGGDLNESERKILLVALKTPLTESDPFAGSAEILSRSDLVELGLSDTEIETLDTGDGKGERQPGAALATKNETPDAPISQLDPPPAPIAKLHDELEGNTKEDKEGEEEGEKPSPTKNSDDLNEAVFKPFARPKPKPRQPGEPIVRTPRTPIQLDESSPVLQPIRTTKHRTGKKVTISESEIENLARSLTGIP